MSAARAADSSWTLLALLLAGFAAVGWVTRGDGLDAATRERPRNPLIDVHLRDLDDGDRVPIDVTGYWELRAPGGTLLASGEGMRGWIAVRPEGVTVGGWKLTSRDAVLHVFGDAALQLDSYHYRGRLLLRGGRGSDEPELELALELPLEDYVVGVLTGEMASARRGVDQALMAQAIAARSYAVAQLRSGREQLRSTVADQRFLSTDFETAAAREAVTATRGVVLLDEQGELFPAFFHADCGGHTSDGPAHGFGDSAVLRGTADDGPAFHQPSRSRWRRTVPAEKLDGLAERWRLGGWATALHVLERDAGGRVLRAQFAGTEDGRVLRGEELRVALGLPSVMLEVYGVLADGSLHVQGLGRGHGIGLCQLGAVAQARSGRSFREILAHYYPGARLTTLTEPVRP